MKKSTTILTLATVVLIFLTGFSVMEKPNSAQEQDAFEVPENIMAIFNESCMDCHNAKSKNKKGKMKLKLDQLTTMKKSKLISKLNKIAKEVTKGDMPPKKFVKNYPEHVPSADNKKVLIDWAKSSASKLAGE